MTRTLGRSARALACALGLSVATIGLADEGPTLTAAWLAWQQANPAAVPWQHAFALRQDTAAGLTERRRRLIAELDTLRVSARVAGDAARAGGLATWRDTLAEWQDEAARTPGRMDLPWLGANLRHDPPLAKLVHFGVCERPGWVEVWSLDGVTRFDWVPDLTLEAALAALSPAAARDADHAVVISPDGALTHRGVAAWNHQPTRLVPGSRVLLLLPVEQGLRAASPFPGTTQEAALINTRLPALIATRLPGDACTITRMP
ncbi:capsule biosynthesis GfcC family protein [Halomonas sp. RA08-2]|uniref:capsule biosynthesis GfcC family protein n=1 Tax=Halomonas sp. RA08-2 TaxID=3440842 RepID=UPI003EECC0BD